jgi:phosphoglycerol transferase MdoB-like AlkP superfamily enzyme
MSGKCASTVNGASALTLLGVAFVVLKLVHVIAWSWWWVTVPFWGPTVLAVLVAIVVLLFVAAVS